MSKTFQRWLDPAAFTEVERVADVLQTWDGSAERAVHLRRGDAISFYVRGRRVAHFAAVGPGKLPSSQDLRRQLHDAESKIGLKHNELSVRSRVATELRRLRLVTLDEEVAVPTAALTDRRLARTRVDLVAVHETTGDLWCIELKLARNDELAFDVLEQLQRTSSLPEAVPDDGFITHYGIVLDQRHRLGLAPADLPQLSGRTRTLLLVVGPPEEAWARIACWDGRVARPDFQVSLWPDASTVGSLQNPEEAVSTALASSRVPYAPRRSRFTAFAAAEDRRQHKWRRQHPNTDGLGPYAGTLREYLEDHHADAHDHLNHLRSSQAFCLQLMAPVMHSPGGEAATGLLEVVGSRLAGFRPNAIESVDFEAPHGAKCASPACRVRLSPRDLFGERTSKWTRLDVLLVLRGTRDGVSTRALVGMEFKYTEPEFGSCGGFVSAGNRQDAHTCLNSPDGGRDDHCYLLTKHGRKYLEQPRKMFCADPFEEPGPCLLLGPVNQLYRSHYAVRAMAPHLGCTEAFFGVLRHADNPDLLASALPIPGHGSSQAGPVDRYRAALAAEVRSTFFDLTLQEVVARWRSTLTPSPDWLTALTRRYLE
jgi:hypothetical protein